LPQTGCNDLGSLKPFKMTASSMQPTIKKGDRILVNLSFYKINRPKRGEIVVFRFPKGPKKLWIKRIVAFGGETIEIKGGAILINDKILDRNIIKKHLYANKKGDVHSIYIFTLCF
jgi:signal peptidase I